MGVIFHPNGMNIRESKISVAGVECSITQDLHKIAYSSHNDTITNYENSVIQSSAVVCPS